MSTNMKTIWAAYPHTEAKIAILSAYLRSYLAILGSSQRGEILYIDGFAGPGSYTNLTQGSPLKAVTSAHQTRSMLGERWKAGVLHMAFIEADKKRFNHLCSKLEPFRNNSQIKIYTYHSLFVEGLKRIRQEVPDPFNKRNPLLVFIDPFGATGAPFEVVAELLHSPCSEILLNLDADGITRILQAGKAANHETNLDQIFGSPSWREVLQGRLSQDEMAARILKFYKQNLLSLPNVDYVFPFEMRSTSQTLNYYLVFASQHYRGLEKMKEAMKSIDQDGSYRFCDAHIGQPMLFRFDAPEDFAFRLYSEFSGKRASYEAVRRYTLNETPFILPSKMLGILEKGNYIDNVEYKGPRRRGAFAPEKTKSVTFRPEVV